MKEYNKVPSIISTKDLDYLQDIFNWQFGAYKNTLDASNMISDKELKKHLDNCLNMFYDDMDEVLMILEGGFNENSQS